MNEKPTLEIPGPRAPMKDFLEFFDIHPELMDIDHLNNFHLYLPGSSTRESLEERDLNSLPSPNKFKSPKRLTQTLGEFLAQVDQALADSGVDLDRLRELEQLKDNASLREDITENIRLRKEIEEMVIPTYKLLRELGYNTYDIIG